MVTNNKKVLPEYIRLILSEFAKRQADSVILEVLPSMNAEDILKMNASLVGDSSYFRDNLSSLIDVGALKSLLSKEFRKIKAEPLDMWDHIVSTLKQSFTKRILPKLKNKIRDLEKENQVSMSQIIESLIVNSDEY